MKLTISRRTSRQRVASVEHRSSLIECVPDRGNRRDSAVKARAELWRDQHAVDDVRVRVDWRRRNTAGMSIVACGLIHLRHITAEPRRVRSISYCPESESLICVHAACKPVSRSESLIDERPFRIVWIEMIEEQRELREATDAYATA